MHGLAVQAVEAHAGRDRATVPTSFSTLLCLVWGMATPGRCRSSEQLAFEHGLDNVFGFRALEKAGAGKAADHFRITLSLVAAVNSG